MLYFIAAWAILTGISEIVQAVELRRVIHNEWLLIAGGVASILFGILAFVFPGVAAISLAWLIGTYAIIVGVALIGLGLGVDVGLHLGACSSAATRCARRIRRPAARSVHARCMGTSLWPRRPAQQWHLCPTASLAYDRAADGMQGERKGRARGVGYFNGHFP